MQALRSIAADPSVAYEGLHKRGDRTSAGKNRNGRQRDCDEY